MKLKKLVLSLLYPRRGTCIGCGSMIGCDRDDLCEECRYEMAMERLGPRPVPKSLGLNGAAFVYPYHGAAGSMVRALKYAGEQVIADNMSKDMAAVITEMKLGSVDCITFVPMHPDRLRVRGFNHARLLAEGTAEKLSIPCEELLRRTRNAKQQARLGHREREENLKDVFAVVKDLTGMRIILIDDMFTTGATAKYCTLALRKAGAAEIYFVSYATGLKKK